jgi:predicted nucleic acid-binding protein
VRSAARFRSAGGRWIGSVLVLGELHGHLIRRIDPDKASRVISTLVSDPMFEWHAVSLDLIREALSDWISRFGEQRFSLTDAVTFALMRRERVTRAFAYDADFITAGFELLA